MPEPADEIRAHAAEVIAESLFLQWSESRGITGMRWASLEWVMQLAHRARAERIVTALADAGLLPTAVEWGGRNDSSSPRHVEMIVTSPHETALRQHAAAYYPAPPLTIVRRYVTSWREADR
ncbi:hypothetical protein [Nocardia puris]|uniref:Uncharacterized protein n=1 Tax=Nocardia puris TaxID=208602 RepID=A0A366DAL2_9NOCA|nr:hypothetical protein [Nocardia puris]RBO87056.1 hypothetical protein DFR74_112236 [Nocardia puris]